MSCLFVCADVRLNYQQIFFIEQIFLLAPVKVDKEFIPFKLPDDYKLLNNWQIKRNEHFEPDRAYIVPKNWRGFKMDYFGNQFGETGMEKISNSYKKQYKKAISDHIDYKLRPSKFGDIKEDIQLKRVLSNNKIPFKPASLTPYDQLQMLNTKMNTHQAEQFRRRRLQASFSNSQLNSYNLHNNSTTFHKYIKTEASLQKI